MNVAFDAKSARLDALALQIHTGDLGELDQALKQRAVQYKELNMPLLLDMQDFDTPNDLNIDGIASLIRSHGLVLAGLRHENDHWSQVAKKHGLPFCQAEGNAHAGTSVVMRAPSEPTIEPTESPASAPPQATVISNPTVFVSSPIRSGQQVYAENGDLIVTGLVSKGAELIADGNIHIYGPMRGRALAGAGGNRDARIFIHSMQAELVSVAGIYRTFEQDLPEHLNHKPVQVYLQDDRLIISAIEAD
ncbi:MAG: septum site-determining protein MinC [Neisseria sp.]|uniref:septum site-determining protein MinC n=1 Tax=Neisseria sp. TaxID=192066 RepID=UPI0026DCD996|nr:septum site-determining protein MinC [Neisseria sp.]MDO4641302.1 septum site-determining protein MinC [Neisseria sp.]